MSLPPNYIGRTLGQYEIQALIASGGMSYVYRGYDTNLNRPVAIKLLADLADAQLVERFRNEARIVANLRHPNIVPVYTYGELDDALYMVQEFLPGPTLEQRMAELAERGEHMQRTEVLAILTDLARALDAAHATGIIHRDIKPGNAMWNASGTLVLTDFGIAKDLHANTRHTRHGVIYGTPAYVSPEQARGFPLTPASDVYSLGVLAYELIAGQPPFSGDSPIALVLAHVQSPPPAPSPLRPGLPPGVDTVIQQAMAKSPEARFAGAGDFVYALSLAWENEAPMAVYGAPTVPLVTLPNDPIPPQIRPPLLATKTRSPRTAILLATFLVILLLGGILLATGNAPQARGTASTGPVAHAQEISTSTPRPTATPRIAPTPSPRPRRTATPRPTAIPPTAIPTMLPTAIPPTAIPTMLPTAIPPTAIPTNPPAQILAPPDKPPAPKPGKDTGKDQGKGNDKGNNKDQGNDKDNKGKNKDR